MTVTAARLGSSPITIDWSGLQYTANHGAQVPVFQQTWAKLKASFDSGEHGFYQAPTRNELSQAEAAQALAQEVLSRGIFTDCLFLGIGGSSLGPISLLQALRGRAHQRITFHFLENPDPVEWRLTLAKLKPETTLVCAVTKSGTTFETLSQLYLALEWLGKPRWSSHVVAITDPEKGDLRALAKQHNIPSLSIAPSIGGRFSIFTPVGLFPAALAGLSIKDFLMGASQTRDAIEKAAPEKNPIFILGSEFLRQATRRPIHVCMPYSSQLKSVGAWFVQLWAESLGKDGKGFTPLAALGATDQHSILQLLRDGPDDKITLFVTVDRVGDEVSIPRRNPDLSRLPAFKILEGHTLQDLLRIEYRATSLVLTRRSRPHLTLQLDALDERNLGAFYFAVACLTAFTGALMGVNPFDQPGVEEAKVYIRQALTAEPPNDVTPESDQSPVARLRRDRETH